MKKFFFPLETLLKVRTETIKLLGQKLFEQAKECHLLTLEEELLEEKIHLALREKNRCREEGQFFLLPLHDAYLTGLEKEKGELNEEKARRQQRLITLQERTSQAIQKRKIVEKLREKKYTLWELEQMRKEHGGEW